MHPHIHIDFKDPALRQTIALGIPTLLATVCMFVSTSITNAAALVVQPETGPSVIAYARLWYTLPYALIAASLSTALYTELSHDAQEKDYDSVRTGISRGVAQMLFFLIPFAMYLIVFARPLNMIYCAGKFDESGVALVSEFLIYLALSLPLYGVVVLMQKSFSALLDMKPYSRYCLYSAIGQAGSVLLFGVVLGYGMPAIALSYVVDTWSWSDAHCGGCAVVCMAFRSSLSCMAVSSAYCSVAWALPRAPASCGHLSTLSERLAARSSLPWATFVLQRRLARCNFWSCLRL